MSQRKNEGLKGKPVQAWLSWGWRSLWPTHKLCFLPIPRIISVGSHLKLGWISSLLPLSSGPWEQKGLVQVALRGWKPLWEGWECMQRRQQAGPMPGDPTLTLPRKSMRSWTSSTRRRRPSWTS